MVAALCAIAGCSKPDEPNMTLAPPKNPEAIKVLDAIKAIPTAAGRRAYMDSHQAETQTLHADASAWKEASKLAWSDVPAQGTAVNTTRRGSQ